MQCRCVGASPHSTSFFVLSKPQIKLLTMSLTFMCLILYALADLAMFESTTAIDHPDRKAVSQYPRARQYWLPLPSVSVLLAMYGIS